MVELAPLPNSGKLLVDRVYEILRSAIQDLKIPPGSALVEGKLAADLQVSKTPIREALARLASEGLVEASPYRSYRVTLLTPDDAKSILELRAVLEGLAARRACDRLDQGEITAIVQTTADADAASREGDWERVSELVHQVHSTLVEGCGDARLRDMIAVLNSQFERARALLPVGPERLNRSLLEHRELAAAVATRQGALAEQIMRVHLTSMVESASQALSGMEPASGDDADDLGAS